MGDNKSTGQFPLPGIALIFVALGLFVFSENAFVPTRPDVSSELSSTAEDVRARLWQDPFEAVEAHKKSKHTGSIDEQVQRLKSKISHYTMYQNQQHRICDINQGETRSNIEKLAAARLKAEEYAAKKAGIKAIKKQEKIVNALLAELVKTSAHTVDELRCQVQRKYEKDLGLYETHRTGVANNDENTDLRILAVMVPGGPYAEDRETRIRSRYAVVSGLSSADYFPTDAEHIGYMDFANLCNGSMEGYPLDPRYCDWPATVPYEWYVSTNIHGKDNAGRAKNLLILWLNDEEISLQQPLNMLQRLRFALTPGVDFNTMNFKVVNLIEKLKDISIQFDVLGPASSTTLVKMYEEASTICFEDDLKDCEGGESDIKNKFGDGRNIKIFSARATIDNATINKKLDDMEGKGDSPAQWLKISKEDETSSVGSWFNIKRTIPTDKVLVDGLLCELLRRDVNPYSKGDKALSRTGCKNVFFKGLNKNGLQDYIVLVGESDTVYSRNFHDLFSTKIKQRNHGKSPEWLLHYNYFRGIDGSTGKGDSKANSKENKKSEKNSLRRPIGENQYDYLRRLGKQLSELSATLSGKGTIRAIGIVGSDAYDKLLVLQALRNKFPGVVFFTTDLDARMLHAEENQWARNLVVASGYGLSPKGGVSDSVIPFRDGYQTSLYTATLAAMNVENVETLISNRASIFEIGNNSAIDYSGNRNYHKQDKTWLYVFLLLVLFSLLMYQTSEKSRSYIISVTVIAVGVSLWVGFFDTESSTEYHELFSGTSIWPSLIIRMTAALFSALFIFYAFMTLKKNAKAIRKEFKLTEDNAADTPKTLVKVCISLWGCQYAKENESEAASIDIRQLISQYFSIGEASWWLRRVLLMAFVYLLLTGLFLASFSDFPYIPYSDRTSAVAQLSVFFISSPLYVFLVFFVVDVTRLNARFVTLVSTCKISWPKEMLKDYCHRYGLSEKVSSEKLKIDLIVLRSKAVDALIFLPFIILTMMIVSRTAYFDRWHMPIQLAIVFLLGACIALGSAIRLRRSAEMARGNALKNLEDIFNRQVFEECKREEKEKIGNDKKYSSAVKIKTDNEMCQVKMSERISRIINEVKSLNGGPFAPIVQHPIVSAIAMPFGGVGSIYLIDYFANFGI